jgi:hypothetical protein
MEANGGYFWVDENAFNRVFEAVRPNWHFAIVPKFFFFFLMFEVTRKIVQAV